MSSFIKSGMLRFPTVAGTFAPISGAAPQTVNGSTLSTMQPHASSGLAVVPGSLSALVVANLTTNTLTLTGKWQVTAGGQSPVWYDVGNDNNAANVVFATGTGVLATTSVAISAPPACHGWLYARFVVTSGVAAGGGAGVDEVAIAYSYRIGEP